MAKKREVGNTFQNHKMQGTKWEGPGEKTGAQTTLRARGSYSLRATSDSCRVNSSKQRQ